MQRNSSVETIFRIQMRAMVAAEHSLVKRLRRSRSMNEPGKCGDAKWGVLKHNNSIFGEAGTLDMAEAVTPSLLAALEQCKDLQTKLTSTISTLEDHNDFLTDKCVQSSEHNIALKSENVQQQDAIVSLSAENILLRQKVHALQEFKEKFEEIRKEVASLRRNNMQLESNQKSLHFQNIEAKNHGQMGRLSDMQSLFLGKEQDKCLKTRAFMNWMTLLINKNSSVDLAKHEADKWQKKYEELVNLRTTETQAASNGRREILAKCDELEAEKRNVHKLSNRVRELALVIAGLQEHHNAELEKVVTDLSRENIGLLASSDAESLSKIRLSMSPITSPEFPARAQNAHDFQFVKASQMALSFRTPRSHALTSEKVESAVRECNDIFRQMAKKQFTDLPIEDRRLRSLSSASIAQGLDPSQLVEIMITVILNVFAKWKLVFPLKKISTTCYEWKGKKWHLAVQGQLLKARVGAGYEEFLPIIHKEFVRNGPAN